MLSVENSELELQPEHDGAPCSPPYRSQTSGNRLARLCTASRYRVFADRSAEVTDVAPLSRTLSRSEEASQRKEIEEGLTKLQEAREQLTTNLADYDSTANLEHLLMDLQAKQADLEAEQRMAGLYASTEPMESPLPTEVLSGPVPSADAKSRTLMLEHAMANLEAKFYEQRDRLAHAEAALRIQDHARGQQAGENKAHMGDRTNGESERKSLLTESSLKGKGSTTHTSAHASTFSTSMQASALHIPWPLTAREAELEAASYKKLSKRAHIDYIGLALFMLFIVCAVGYAFARIKYSLGPLGPLLGYGIFIFVIEMMGALSILFYGVWLIAKPDNTDLKPIDIDAPLDKSGLRRRYNIRVLIPCYKESLAIVRRTVIAAHMAALPKGCSATIYLCDDGDDPKKRAFVTELESDRVVYVSGRNKKAARTTNGKSENLNFALRKIYPADANSDGTPNIPLLELVCLLDADQTCSRNSFFPTLLAYIDSGDNVGAALTPQFMYNASKFDIFNHQNIPFWEKMQPGMDALGFISLTGTNMLLRSRALQSCGWFPTESVTEDWELGMRMKGQQWQFRYCCEYLATGEAPVEVREALQQRSRWCKGHFQTFWSSSCPLIDRRLGLFYRLTYSSTCLSYVTCGWTVPIMTLVPVITLLFGYFPIALNFPTVLAITIYYVVLNALTYYSTSIREYRAIWLANTANTIFFWPYLKASIATPIKSCMGRGLTFKATAKGRGSSMISIAQLLPWLFLFLLSAFAFIVGLSSLNVNVNAPMLIALCWVIYNAIPMFLLLAYSWLGPGRGVDIISQVSIVVSIIVSLFAICAMWLFYPTEEDYVKANDLSLQFLNAERSGRLPENFPIKWRADSGLQYEGEFPLVVGPPDNETLLEDEDALGVTEDFELDVSGGFYMDGQAGPVKMTFHVALVTSMLSWSLLEYPAFWNEDRERRSAALNLVTHGLQYVNNCYLPDYEGEGIEGDIFIFQVGDIEKEFGAWNRPEDVTEADMVLNLMGRDKPLDLASQMVAAIASASLVMHVYEQDVVSPVDEMNKVHRLFQGITDLAERIGSSDSASDGLYTRAGYLRNLTNEADPSPEVAVDSLYPSHSFYDDIFWAATWMFRATTLDFRRGDSREYMTAMTTYMNKAYKQSDVMAVSPDYITNVAVVHAAVVSRTLAFHEQAQSFLWDWQCTKDVKHTTHGRAYYEATPMLGSTVTTAALASVYVYKVTNDPKMSRLSRNDDFHKGFRCFAETQARYVLGVDKYVLRRKPMVVGYSSSSAEYTFHRGASCPAYPAACGPEYTGTDNVEPDFNQVNGALLWMPDFSDSVPDARSEDTTISLENNWGMPLLWAAVSSNKFPYVQCLQGQGPFSRSLVCKHSRPREDRLGDENDPPPHPPFGELNL